MNAIAAESTAEAERLFTTQQQSFARIRRGETGRIPPPLTSARALRDAFSPDELRGVEMALACSAIGTPEDVARGIQAFATRHQADEVILSGMVFDHGARVRSQSMIAAACGLPSS